MMLFATSARRQPYCNSTYIQYNNDIMKNKKTNLLNQDIQQRLQDEAEHTRQPQKEREHGKTAQIAAAVIIAIIVLAGVIYPLIR
ncbi:hypothetical protein [uncultured Lacticaseibacillus sp.]|uniref:hypothetical protein n=1 Tax=uncultured Lacticaseibacillus sp. TaxID=2775882 RepID=UPI0025921825|nr:hypothetical protein [uncultured Lacticaseibacillus sp.]